MISYDIRRPAYPREHAGRFYILDLFSVNEYVFYNALNGER